MQQLYEDLQPPEMKEMEKYLKMTCGDKSSKRGKSACF